MLLNNKKGTAIKLLCLCCENDICMIKYKQEDKFEQVEQIGMWKFTHLFDIILLEKFEFA